MKQHPLYTHLYLTKDGKVFSTKSNKYLSLFKHKNGRLVFSTRLHGKDSPSICFKVHRLVAETYLENPNNLPQVNHIDGNPLNNCVSNLEWCTASNNMKHAYRTGLMPSQSKTANGCFRRTREDIELAKTYRKNGFSFRKIGQLLGVSHSVVQRWVSW